MEKYFKDFNKDMQEKLNKLEHEKEFKRREYYYPVITNEDLLPWYFKTDYINNWSYPDNFLFSTCPVCGLTDVFSECLSDETGNDGLSRDAVLKCQCGHIYDIVG